MQSSLTEGKVGSLLLRFSLPILLAGLVQMSHGLVNVFFLNRFASPASVAGALNGILSVMMITSLFMGLLSGGMIMLGQFVGAGQDDSSTKTVGNAITLQLMMGILATGLIFALGGWLTNILGVPTAVDENGISAAAEAMRYIRTMAFGTIFQMGFNLINSLLRALGDSKRPMIFIAIAVGIHIALDYVFIGMLGLGAGGAALASVLANICGLIIALVYLLRKKLPFAFKFGNIRPNREIMKKTFKLGVPISLQVALNTVSFLVIARIINGMGVFAAAANSNVNSIINLIFIVPMAIGNALSSISAQNLGAGKTDRALKSTKLGILFALVIAVPATIIANVIPTELVSLIADDPYVIRASAEFIVPFSWDLVILSFMLCVTGFLNGCGRTTFVAIAETVAAFAVRIPVTWILSRVPGATLFHVGIGTPAATLASLIMLLVYYKVKLSCGKLDTLRIAGEA
ncbi:MAG: MATE family efflux transporter [Oscillospiraceae bacterium]|nr:MATE family efflux transporter [Oscillospiraceae bacterium]